MKCLLRLGPRGRRPLAAPSGAAVLGALLAACLARRVPLGRGKWPVGKLWDDTYMSQAPQNLERGRILGHGISMARGSWSSRHDAVTVVTGPERRAVPQIPSCPQASPSHRGLAPRVQMHSGVALRRAHSPR